MVVFPNAKINIGLNIVARREDGYHDIETVFYPIDICDIIEITPSPPGFRFECHPAPDGSGPGPGAAPAHLDRRDAAPRRTSGGRERQPLRE